MKFYTNSPACSAGIKKGDVIIRLDGGESPMKTQLRALLFGKKTRDKVRIDYSSRAGTRRCGDRYRGRSLSVSARHSVAGRQAALARGQNRQFLLSFPLSPSLLKKLNMMKGAEIETGSARTCNHRCRCHHNHSGNRFLLTGCRKQHKALLQLRQKVWL